MYAPRSQTPRPVNPVHIHGKKHGSASDSSEAAALFIYAQAMAGLRPHFDLFHGYVNISVFRTLWLTAAKQVWTEKLSSALIHAHR